MHLCPPDTDLDQYQHDCNKGRFQALSEQTPLRVLMKANCCMLKAPLSWDKFTPMEPDMFNDLKKTRDLFTSENDYDYTATIGL